MGLLKKLEDSSAVFTDYVTRGGDRNSKIRHYCLLAIIVFIGIRPYYFNS